MHITITGNLGSGKSTICKILEDKFGFEIYSTGKVQRELARQMNMTTLEMNQLMCSDHMMQLLQYPERIRIRTLYSIPGWPGTLWKNLLRYFWQ